MSRRKKLTGMGVAAWFYGLPGVRAISLEAPPAIDAQATTPGGAENRPREAADKRPCASLGGVCPVCGQDIESVPPSESETGLDCASSARHRQFGPQLPDAVRRVQTEAAVREWELDRRSIPFELAKGRGW